jgi:DNA primase
VGSRFTGLCPFHEERTPSFSVDAERGLYHCFGCQTGGDAIRLVQELESLDFPEAVEQLAERYGVELAREREDPREEQRRRRRERLLSLIDRTATFYSNFLWESAEAARARRYLVERQLSEEVLREFRVGYAPKAWDRVLVAARRDGFSDEELLGAGLVQRARNGNLLDRFRERIMFPLADARGRVLGFGARAMRDEQGAKYINTSEGELYHKGRQLFGLDRARGAIAKAGRAVVVEGYTDVLALHGAGLDESVGIMGTALTQEQLGELARAVGEEGAVYLALDADSSGQQAMLRAARIAEERQIGLRVVQMPEGRDPADLVASEGAEALQERLAGAISVLEFEVGRALADGDLDTPEGRDRTLMATRKLIAAAPERSATRDHLVRIVADRLDVPADYVVAGGGEGAGRAPVAAAVEPEIRSASLGAEQVYLALCMASGPKGREALVALEDAHLPSDVLRRARNHLVEHFDDPLEGLPTDDAALAELVAAIAIRADESGAAEGDALRLSFLVLEERRIDREIRQARNAGDLERLSELASARQDVKGERGTVMGQAS